MKATNIWNFINKSGPNGCWLWLGYINPKGYGIIKRENRKQKAHIYIYNTLRRTKEDTDYLHHTCERKDCVNPDHLKPMSARDHRLSHTDGIGGKMYARIRAKD